MKRKYFEWFMLIFATIEPIATIPQIVEVWKGGGAEGVSLVTWLLYSLTSCIWLIYGITQRDKPLILSGILWVTSQGLVVAGLLV